MISNDEFNLALKNKDFTNIMNSAGNKFEGIINRGDLENVKLIGLWKALSNFDDKKKTKITSYIYYRVEWECKRFLREKQEFNCVPLKVSGSSSPNLDIDSYDVNDLLSVLSVESKKIISKYYFGNFTIKEISDQMNKPSEYIRRKLNSSLLKLKRNLQY